MITYAPTYAPTYAYALTYAPTYGTAPAFGVGAVVSVKEAYWSQ